MIARCAQTSAPIPTGRHQAGFTMIEVLITVLVLSIGLLGLAALQATGLKESQMAYMRSQAVLLAYDMADRIRANSVQSDQYDFDLTPNAGTVAESDRNEWNANLALLPDSIGDVQDNGGGDFTITVRWNETRDPAVVDTDCPNDDSDGKDLQCYVLEVAL